MRAIGPSWVQPLPVRRLLFPAASFGFSYRTVLLVVFTPPAILSSGSPPPRSHSIRQLHPNAHIQVLLSCGLVPYNARQKQAPVFPGGFQPPAPSVRRVSHPLDVLLRLQPWRACFIPPASLGLSPDLVCSPRPFDRSRADAPGFPLQGFPSLHDEPVLACSPLVHFVRIPGEGEFR
jgi:hypothetical protein